MSRRVSRGIVALAVLPLGGSALAVLSPVMSGSATAACAPSLTVTPHAKAAKKPKVHAAKPVVSKLHKKKYVAKVAITAKQGTATVVAAQSVCPDGATGAAASTTQSAGGKGTVTKSVSAKGRSKKAAKKAVKAKAKKAVAKLKKKGATKKGRKKAKKRAIAAARPLAVSRAHDALYLSDVVYLSKDSAGVLHGTATPPPGKPTVRVTPGVGDAIVVSVPAGFDVASAQDALGCIRRAPAWPTRFIFDGGEATSPQLPSYAAAHANEWGIEDVVIGNVEGSTSAQNADQTWQSFWARHVSAGEPTVVTHFDGLTKGPAPATAADQLVCFETSANKDPGAFTVTLHGATVGTTVSAPDDNVLVHVVGGLAVTLR